ncbi:tyrosine-protein phosphatase [Chengkuizengella axinellae]|uniref:Tyrosine-protein phosphatase n=1 Tax=Chengkuizengella axinellae TaxID=3064388 RepID=A0ABT9J4Q4_9BACL|nr:CpsB/CapC family capsule biosynthesis tyrosine phosphatase [Chengkuizengella sp. 2205SS18-9]MDP5275970.1 CpsB/CapC family capsule biosynthesis tyrosine phosphatase [Chengkuizengella sp. 2205SS18-9]
MIDINCNFLSRIDDITKERFWKLRTLKEVEKQGVTHIVAIHRFNKEKLLSEKEHLLSVVSELNENIKKEGMNIKVLVGHQVVIYDEIVEDFNRDIILSLNNDNKYIFISLPSIHIPQSIYRVIYELQMIGLKPVIVLPERNAAIVNNPTILYRLVRKGVFTQVGASSLMGRFGKKTQKTALQFIAGQLTHFVATEEDQYDDLIRSYEKIQQEFGESVRYKMLENAKKLVDNKMFNEDEPVKLKRKRWLY